MSCHYSCASCLGNIYYDLCTSCPTTRTLSASLCTCQSGYYEIQQAQCELSTSATFIDKILIQLAGATFFLAIGFHILTLVLTLNRLISPKLKKIIDTMQVIALISYYRFLQNQVASSALKVLNVFNFNYLTTLVCDVQSPPYGCNTFQNLIGPGLTILLFFGIFLLGYPIASCIYYTNSDDDNVVYIRNGKEERAKTNGSLSFKGYWQATNKSLLLLYLDQTVIQSSVALSQIGITNYWGLFLILPFLLLVAVAGRVHFTTINDSSQTTLIYRAKHSYFFLYDKYYHLNYIDHIFESQNLSKDKTKLKKQFYPDSNLIIIQLLFKILLATSTIVFYQYEPYLFAYLCILLLAIFIITMDHIFYYERSTLFFYILCIITHGYAVGTFFLSSLFSYFVNIFSIIGLIIIIICIIAIIADWKGSREGEMVNKIYEVETDESVSNKVGNILEESEDELILNRQEKQKIGPLETEELQLPTDNQPPRATRMTRMANNTLGNRLTTNAITNPNMPNTTVRSRNVLARKTNRDRVAQVLSFIDKPVEKEATNLLDLPEEKISLRQAKKGEELNSRIESRREGDRNSLREAFKGEGEISLKEEAGKNSLRATQKEEQKSQANSIKKKSEKLSENKQGKQISLKQSRNISVRNMERERNSALQHINEEKESNLQQSQKQEEPKQPSEKKISLKQNSKNIFEEQHENQQ